MSDDYLGGWRLSCSTNFDLKLLACWQLRAPMEQTGPRCLCGSGAGRVPAFSVQQVSLSHEWNHNHLKIVSCSAFFKSVAQHFQDWLPRRLGPEVPLPSLIWFPTCVNVLYQVAKLVSEQCCWHRIGGPRSWGFDSCAKQLQLQLCRLFIHRVCVMMMWSWFPVMMT